MTDLDKMARELLTVELDKQGQRDSAADVYANRLDDVTRAAVSAIRTALLTAPPCWKLVPVVPTPMMIATFRADNEHGALSWMTHTALRCADFGSRYAGMLAAAPEVK